jgi:5-methylcytosine-specific restriction enzyme A
MDLQKEYKDGLRFFRVLLFALVISSLTWYGGYKIIANWCNGSTRVSETLSSGSSPELATNLFTIEGIPRSSQWPKVRREHLKREPLCQWDFCTNNIEVHHIKPFHIDVMLELDTNNLITLCDCTNHRCHIDIGHLGNFRTGYNLNVRSDCEAHKKSLIEK